MANFGFNLQLPDISEDDLQNRQAILAIKNQLYALQEQLRYTFGNLNFADHFGSTVSLGGKNNSAGVLEIKNERGNVMVLLNKQGITMSNGTDIFGAAGLLSSFQYTSGNWQNLGYTYQPSNGYTVRKPLTFMVEIPENFQVKSARITLYHALREMTVYYTNPSDPTGAPKRETFFGYARNVKLYRATGFWSYREKITYNSDSTGKPAEPAAEEVAGAFGEDGYTPPTPDPDDVQTLQVDRATSGDISAVLKPGINHLILQTGNKDPLAEGAGGDLDGFEVREETQTGTVIAVLDITGYMK